MDSFDTWVTFCLQEEGGFSCEREDPGNWTGGVVGSGVLKGTKFGISAAAYPDLDIANLTQDVAMATYRRDYWDVMSCEMMPLGIDLMVCDHGINAGPKTSIRILQQALGVGADGIIGPVTRLALRGADVAATLAGLNRRQGAYYRSLSTFDTFGRGWLARLGRRYALARQMAGLA